MELTHKFYWGNTPERASRKGQMCRIVGQIGWDVCVVEFKDGHQMTVPKKSIRRQVLTGRASNAGDSQARG